jgi:preprotein translocase subunit SecG
MVKILGFLINFFVILLILFRVPTESAGLASFATKSNLLGSPSSAQRSLNILTGIGIFIYFIIAIALNFSNR